MAKRKPAAKKPAAPAKKKKAEKQQASKPAPASPRKKPAAAKKPTAKAPARKKAAPAPGKKPSAKAAPAPAKKPSAKAAPASAKKPSATAAPAPKKQTTPNAAPAPAKKPAPVKKRTAAARAAPAPRKQTTPEAAAPRAVPPASPPSAPDLLALVDAGWTELEPGTVMEPVAEAPSAEALPPPVAAEPAPPRPPVTLESLAHFLRGVGKGTLDLQPIEEGLAWLVPGLGGSASSYFKIALRTSAGDLLGTWDPEGRFDRPDLPVVLLSAGGQQWLVGESTVDFLTLLPHGVGLRGDDSPQALSPALVGFLRGLGLEPAADPRARLQVLGQRSRDLASWIDDTLQRPPSSPGAHTVSAVAPRADLSLGTLEHFLAGPEGSSIDLRPIGQDHEVLSPLLGEATRFLKIAFRTEGGDLVGTWDPSGRFTSGDLPVVWLSPAGEQCLVGEHVTDFFTLLPYGSRILTGVPRLARDYRRQPNDFSSPDEAFDRGVLDQALAEAPAMTRFVRELGLEPAPDPVGRLLALMELDGWMSRTLGR